MSAADDYRTAKRAHCLACWPDMCVCDLDDAVRALIVEALRQTVPTSDDGFERIAAELLPKE